MSHNPELKTQKITNLNVPFTTDKVSKGIEITLPVTYDNPGMKLKQVVMTDPTISSKHFTGYLYCKNIDALNKKSVSNLNYDSLPTHIRQKYPNEEKMDKVDLKVFSYFNRNKRVNEASAVKVNMKKHDRATLLTNPLIGEAYATFKKDLEAKRVIEKAPKSLNEWLKNVATAAQRFTEQDFIAIKKAYPVMDNKVVVSPPQKGLKATNKKQYEALESFWGLVFTLVKKTGFTSQEKNQMSTLAMPKKVFDELLDTISFILEQLGKVKSLKFILFIDHILGNDESDLLYKEEVGVFNADLKLLYGF